MHTGFTNKSRVYQHDPQRWESYATATADGLTGLLATGCNTNDRHVLMALEWLKDHPVLNFVEGIPQDDPAQWHLVMRYYHLATRAEAYAYAGYFEGWPGEINALLSAEQLADGSFKNPMGAPNKEDDPLLATTFAIIALNAIVQAE